VQQAALGTGGNFIERGWFNRPLAMYWRAAAHQVLQASSEL
jgi:hypothetical protein